jgi:hypothetical protein
MLVTLTLDDLREWPASLRLLLSGKRPAAEEHPLSGLNGGDHPSSGHGRQWAIRLDRPIVIQIEPQVMHFLDPSHEGRAPDPATPAIEIRIAEQSDAPIAGLLPPTRGALPAGDAPGTADAAGQPGAESPDAKGPVLWRATGSRSAPANLDSLVKGQRLLELLFEEESRPSMQWLRAQVHAKAIPYIKRGRLFFFRPRTVIEWFSQRECRPAMMRAPT